MDLRLVGHDGLVPFLFGVAVAAAMWALLQVWRWQSRPRGDGQAPGPPAEPLPALPLDVHLCLNALSRLCIALSEDERAQDGVEALGAYVVASHKATQSAASARLRETQNAVDAHWRLNCWLRGERAPALAWHTTGVLASAYGASALASALQRLLASAERPALTTVRIVLQITDEPDLRQQVAQLALTALAVSGEAPVWVASQRITLPLDAG